MPISFIFFHIKHWTIFYLSVNTALHRCVTFHPHKFHSSYKIHKYALQRELTSHHKVVFSYICPIKFTGSAFFLSTSSTCLKLAGLARCSLCPFLDIICIITRCPMCWITVKVNEAVKRIHRDVVARRCGKYRIFWGACMSEMDYTRLIFEIENVTIEGPQL